MFSIGARRRARLSPWSRMPASRRRARGHEWAGRPRRGMVEYTDAAECGLPPARLMRAGSDRQRDSGPPSHAERPGALVRLAKDVGRSHEERFRPPRRTSLKIAENPKGRGARRAACESRGARHSQNPQSAGPRRLAAAARRVSNLTPAAVQARCWRCSAFFLVFSNSRPPRERLEPNPARSAKSARRVRKQYGCLRPTGGSDAGYTASLRPATPLPKT